jgi:dipeptidyl aminopeptidase/acylaminoacyl peptidase
MPTLEGFIVCDDVYPGAPICSGQRLADGWIAFTAQKGKDTAPEVAHVAQLDGNGHWVADLAHLSEPAWSPSGRYVVWLGAVPAESYLPGAATASPGAWVPVLPVAFDLDGRRVQSETLRTLEPTSLGRSAFLSHGVGAGTEDWLLAADRRAGGGTVAVPLPSGEPLRWPEVRSGDREVDWEWSPDGRVATLRLVRAPTDHQVLEIRDGVDASTTISHTLPGEPARHLLAWPGGDRILALQSMHVLASTNWRYPRLLSVDITHGTEQVLDVEWPMFASYVLHQSGLEGVYEAHPSRPGTVAMVRYGGAEQDWRHFAESDQLVIVDVATGEVRALTDGPMLIASPRWSPDGRSIAFAAIDRPADMPGDLTHLEQAQIHGLRRGLAIHVVDVDTGAVRRVSEPAEGWDSRPEWSGDGSKLVFMRSFDPPDGSGRPLHQVRVVSPAGGEDALLLDHVGADWAYRPATGRSGG